MDRCLEKSSAGQTHDTFPKYSRIQQLCMNSFSAELQRSQSTKRGRLFHSFQGHTHWHQRYICTCQSINLFALNSCQELCFHCTERVKPHLWYWNTSESTTPHRSTGSARVPAGLSSAQRGSLAGPGCVVRKGWRAHVSGGALAAAVPHGTGTVTDAIQHPYPRGNTARRDRRGAGPARGWAEPSHPACLVRRARAAPARPACGARLCVNANERRARRRGGRSPSPPPPVSGPGSQVPGESGVTAARAQATGIKADRRRGGKTK